jgi:hypothetical protein
MIREQLHVLMDSAWANGKESQAFLNFVWWWGCLINPYMWLCELIKAYDTSRAYSMYQTRIYGMSRSQDRSEETIYRGIAWEVRSWRLACRRQRRRLELSSSNNYIGKEGYMMWWDIDVKELAGTETTQPFFIYMEKIQSVMICSQEDFVTTF